MSWPLTREVYRHGADLDSAAKAVLLALAYHANREGLAWPRLATLVSDTGLSQSTVQRALDRLEVHRMVEIIHSPGRSATYLITLVTMTSTLVTVTTPLVTVTRGRRTGNEVVKNAPPPGSASRPAAGANGRAHASTAPVWVELPDGTVKRAT
jgi:hypothetical protein